MGAIEEVDRMQKSGATEEQIVSSLQNKGFSRNEITDAMNQNRIKSAVQDPFQSQDSLQPSMLQETENTSQRPPIPQSSSSVSQFSPQQPSQQTAQAYPDYSNYSAPQPQTQQPYYPPSYQDPSYQQDPSQGQYSDYQPNLSTDTISEITEQIVSEKFSTLRAQLEKIIDLKNTFETKIQILDDRVKQIEKIIDRLQLSVLQKVGDYITNVDDIKKEVIETQKSIKALAQSKHR